MGGYMLSDKNIKLIANELYDAGKSKKAVESLVSRFSDVTIECAYKIQIENIKRRIDEGERIIGKKIGLTSLPMQKLLGVYEPDYGQIFDTMFLPGNELSMSDVIQPKAEGEIAFVMKESLKGPGITPFDIIRATDFVMPAIEIIDSRVKDWKIKIQDTIADNASSAFIVVGTKYLSLNEVDMFTTGMVLRINGEVVNTGAAAAVMGNPVSSVTWLVNKLSEFGVGVKKGEIILSGSLTAAVALNKNDIVDVVFDRLGQVTLKVIT
jgi:2-keto-4-pentenoate hydratase